MKRECFGLLILILPGVLPCGNAAANGGSSEKIVRVVTVSQAQLQREANDLLDPTMAILNHSASFQPDIACLPEMFTNRPAETVPGPVTERLASWAREHSSYVIFGLRTKENGRTYNSAILIDRKGQVIEAVGDVNLERARSSVNTIRFIRPREKSRTEQLRVTMSVRRYSRPILARSASRYVLMSTGAMSGIA